MHTQPLFSIKHLKKYFPVGGFGKNRRYLRANDDVSFCIYKGETLALVGESGSGKSTLGKTLLQLQKPTGGEVRYLGDSDRVNDGAEEENGVDLTTLSIGQMRTLRRRLQIVFQDPYSSLNPRMTVGQIVGEGVVTHGFFKKKSTALQEYVAETLRACGLSPDTASRYPHEFSGGQRQRIGIARALAVQPTFVVCDECVSALDTSVQSQILNLLSERKEQEKLTYLFISHDLSVVRHIADRIAVMYLGKIVEIGDVNTVFDGARHPYTIALLSAAPTIGQRKSGSQILLGGNIPSAISPPTGCPFHTRCFMAKEECTRIPPPLVEIEPGHAVACHFAAIKTKDKRKLAYEKQGEV